MKAWIVLLLTFILACESSGSDDDKGSNSDIPKDPGGSAPVANANNRVPAAKFQKINGNRISIEVQGVLDSLGNPVTFISDGSNSDGNNIFVTEDGVLKGIKVTQVGSGNILSADIVFTVDNSGSMGQEADSIAARITDFVDVVANSGLDVKVGIVGYSSSVTGALDLGHKDSLKSYLNRSGKRGTSRTRGFYGSNADSLSAKRYNYNGPGGENGVEAIFFANDLFNWRSSANKVFINFTDEGNQPGNDSTYNIKALCDKLAGSATVHTIFSSDTSGQNWRSTWENPLEMSFCTGGTTKLISRNASDLDLSTIPVVGALSKTSKIEFVSSNGSGKHEVVITIYLNKSINGKKIFSNISY